jgi:GH24 family phage-related lysozyme (muramidase)
MRPAAIPVFRAKTQTIEGRKSFGYRDTRGNITIGIGHLVPSLAAWLALPWDGIDAATLTSEWDCIRLMPFGVEWGAGYYATSTTSRLSDDAIDRLFESDVEACEFEARPLFSGYPYYPADGQMGVCSMIFAMGAKNMQGFPLCCAAIRRGDWTGAAAQCHMAGCSDARNSWTKACFLAAAAHPDDVDAVHVS